MLIIIIIIIKNKKYSIKAELLCFGVVNISEPKVKSRRQKANALNVRPA